MSNTMRITLIVSLALNFFFLGIGASMFGHHLFGRSHHDGFFIAGHGPQMMGPRGIAGPGPHMIMGVLDADSRKKVGDILDANRDAMRASFDAMRSARQETYKALTADPFSVEALEAAFAKSRDADMKALEEGHKTAVQIVSSLTPEERAKVAKAMQAKGGTFHKKLGNRRGGWRGWSPDGDIDDEIERGGAVPPPPEGAPPPSQP